LEEMSNFNKQPYGWTNEGLFKLAFVALYGLTQLVGMASVILVFALILYQHYVHPPASQTMNVAENQNQSFTPQATEIPTHTDEPTLVVLPMEQATPTPTVQESAVALDTLPTPTATFTQEPLPTLTPMATSIAMIETDICSPLKGIEISELPAVISQTYSVPNPYSDFGHHGVDLGSYDYQGKGLYGNPVQSVFPGRVAGIIVNRPPIGNSIIIETLYSEIPVRFRAMMNIQDGQSLYIMYSHMIDPSDLDIGNPVLCGQVIGNVGQSQTVEAHLHFETTIGNSGYVIPSMAYYDTSATESESATYLWWRTSGDFMPFDPMNLFSNIY
jgi:murein DD-endopeptidase MepM/ murein hydrolase activator NlpD